MNKSLKLLLVLFGMVAFALAARADYTDNCITFSSANSFTLKTHNNKHNWSGHLWTSTDKTNWTEWNGGEVTAAQTNGAGEYKLHVSGDENNSRIAGTDENDWYWVLTPAVAGTGIACTGNIETLRGATGDNPSPKNMAAGCYKELFADCEALTMAPTMPATTLAENCYYGMFKNCKSLTNAPALPAMTLAKHCYAHMFENCASLSAAPALPATDLEEYCYNAMFKDCKSLSAAPVLPGERVYEQTYAFMFSGCASLTAAPMLPANVIGGSSCYAYMFENCTSLTSIPELPAPGTTSQCYYSMFKGCSALKVNLSGSGKKWSLPKDLSQADEWGYEMFAGTGGDFTGQPTPGTTYYVASMPIVPGTEEDPWQLGATTADTVKAWTNEFGALVIAGTGNMRDFAAGGADIPWRVADISVVDIAETVTSIGQNVWHGLGDNVKYNGLSSGAAKTMSDGFGGTSGSGRATFKGIHADGSVNLEVALETAGALPAQRTEIKLQAEDVTVNNAGHIVITHEAASPTQGFYTLQPVE